MAIPSVLGFSVSSLDHPFQTPRFTTGRDQVGNVGDNLFTPAEQEAVSTEESSPTRRRSSNLTSEQGLQAAQNLLFNQGQLNQASIQFQQQRGGDEVAMSPQGRTRALIGNMTKMGDTMYQQHSGGANGESYGKVQLGEMLSSLRGNSRPQFAQQFAVPRIGGAFGAMQQIQFAQTDAPQEQLNRVA